MFSKIAYTLKQAFSQMGRNKGMNITSVVAITAMMLILGLFFVAFLNVDLFAKTIEKDYNVVEVFIADGADDAVKDAIKSKIEKIDGIEKIEYRSKEDAIKIMKKRWGDNAYLLDNIDKNSLPDSYMVFVKDQKVGNEVNSEISSVNGVDSIKYYQDTVSKLTKITHFIQVSAIVVMTFLIIVSTIIVANTIKLTVFNRSKEIEIMKYIGATDWFVRAPFLIEGIILGIISSAVATGLMHLIYSRLISLLGDDIMRILSVPVLSSSYLIPNLAIIFASLGIGIGTCGSIISIRRFLDR
ncbi:permease-like cell division protein FtsX [Alterileibacterium massiliense]|uniref:permease-like cell division protein FtsX n=1 Tax=Alterileibacterium massiliense TaxID=1870997 RepID=UPI0008DAB046|nr:permease-like cell division protein FtsX [Alterileibacterium massiliense]